MFYTGLYITAIYDQKNFTKFTIYRWNFNKYEIKYVFVISNIPTFYRNINRDKIIVNKEQWRFSEVKKEMEQL